MDGVTEHLRESWKKAAKADPRLAKAARQDEAGSLVLGSALRQHLLCGYRERCSLTPLTPVQRLT
jgi:hypothetical protein